MLTTHAERPVGKILLAFAIIYFVWGSTFFAIRVGVHAMPPLTMAALRFVISGIVLVAWQLSRGEKLPVRREWASATFLGFLIFVCDYGLLFWAEQTVPSGVAAVVLATIPVLIPAAGIFGEFSRFHPATVSFGAWMALLYLIVFGSIIGFTAYVWLLHHESPTKVGTYAYVNPVIAVIVGYFLGGEAVGARTLIGTACVLVSVVVITRARAAKPAPQGQPELAERR